MGAIPYFDVLGTGVTFRVWSPHAISVAVRGSFNGWGTTAMAKENTNISSMVPIGGRIRAAGK
jgi:1,4-alpha-glucan branching enzyme